jgi:hypothetical protein
MKNKLDESLPVGLVGAVEKTVAHINEAVQHKAGEDRDVVKEAAVGDNIESSKANKENQEGNKMGKETEGVGIAVSELKVGEPLSAETVKAIANQVVTAQAAQQETEGLRTSKASLEKDLTTTKDEFQKVVAERDGLKNEIAESKKAVASKDAEIAELKKTVAAHQKEATTAKRKEVLASKACLLDGAKGEAQLGRVVEMTEEAFASYVDELEGLKALAGCAKDDEKKKKTEAETAEAAKTDKKVEVEEEVKKDKKAKAESEEGSEGKAVASKDGEDGEELETAMASMKAVAARVGGAQGGEEILMQAIANAQAQPQVSQSGLSIYAQM